MFVGFTEAFERPLLETTTLLNRASPRAPCSGTPAPSEHASSRKSLIPHTCKASNGPKYFAAFKWLTATVLTTTQHKAVVIQWVLRVFRAYGVVVRSVGTKKLRGMCVQARNHIRVLYAFTVALHHVGSAFEGTLLTVVYLVQVPYSQ